jgi:hypothetical protein
MGSLSEPIGVRTMADFHVSFNRRYTVNQKLPFKGPLFKDRLKGRKG